MFLHAKMDLSQMVKSAGNSAHTNSSVMELSATNQPHTEEDLDMLNSTQDTKSGEPSGIQNAETTSTTLDAASAHQIAQLVWMILASLALRTPITETSLIAHHWFAHQSLLNPDLCATQNALIKPTVLAQSAGEDAHLVPPSVVLSA